MDNDIKAFVMQDEQVPGHVVSLYIDIGYLDEDEDEGQEETKDGVVDNLGVARIFEQLFWQLGNPEEEEDTWAEVKSKYTVFTSSTMAAPYMKFTARMDAGGLDEVLQQIANSIQ